MLTLYEQINKNDHITLLYDNSNAVQVNFNTYLLN